MDQKPLGGSKKAINVKFVRNLAHLYLGKSLGDVFLFYDKFDFWALGTCS